MAERVHVEEGVEIRCAPEAVWDVVADPFRALKKLVENT
jgi:hypothetical protein